MNSYHRWLIKQRMYCENVRCGMVPATHVRNINGKDYVFCDEHCTRLDAARKSDKRQATDTDAKCWNRELTDEELRKLYKSDKRQEKDAYGNQILSF